MGAKLLEHNEMTVFYYPTSVEDGLALGEKGKILTPFDYEKSRLTDMLLNDFRREKNYAYDRIQLVYGNENCYIDIDRLKSKSLGLKPNNIEKILTRMEQAAFAMTTKRVAIVRHPKDVLRKNGAKDTTDEDTWVHSIRLYGNQALAERHLEHPPYKMILGIETDHETQEVIFVPGPIKLECALKELHMKMPIEEEIIIRRMYRKYEPKTAIIK